MMLFLSDVLAADVREIVNKPGLVDWQREYCNMLVDNKLQPDQGTAVFFMEQHWAATPSAISASPVIIHLAESARLSGIPRYPAWPAELPDRLLLTLDQSWGVGGYRLPSIFIARCTAENALYEESALFTLQAAGIAVDRFALEPIKQNHWLISFQSPSPESMQSGWMVTRLTGDHIEALLASDNAADYCAICDEIGIPIDTEYDHVKAATFDVHRLVVATIHHLSMGELPAFRPVHVNIGGKAIAAHQITVEERAPDYEQ